METDSGFRALRDAEAPGSADRRQTPPVEGATVETDQKSPGAASRAFRIIGAIVVIASLIFLVQRVWSSRLWTSEGLKPIQATIVVAAGALAYGCSALLLSTAWCAWLRWAGRRRVAFGLCHSIYGRTQIAKYLPGNVFHFAGRHVLGRRCGLEHKPLAAAAVMEFVAVASASAGLGLAGVGAWGAQQAAGNIPLWLVAVAAVCIIASPPLFMIAAPRLPGPLRLAVPPAARKWDLLRHLAPPYACTFLFMLMAGAIFAAVVFTAVDSKSNPPATLVIGVFAMSWLIGFLTPGASGGIGVREAAMVIPLAPAIGEPQALLAALLMRMITFLGDLVFFGIAHLFQSGQMETDDGRAR